MAALTAALAVGPSVRAASPRTFTVDPEQSRALIDVGKSGAFSFAGHTHEVEAPLTSGVVHLDTDDPSHDDVRLEFNAAAMRVTGKGESGVRRAEGDGDDAERHGARREPLPGDHLREHERHGERARRPRSTCRSPAG